MSHRSESGRAERQALLGRSRSERRARPPPVAVVQERRPRGRAAAIAVAGTPVNDGWYHGVLDHLTAENRIRMVEPPPVNGTYLVYDDGTHTGLYSIVIYIDGSVLRLHITRRRDGKYVLGRDCPGAIPHDSVARLIRYHRGCTGERIELESGGFIKLSRSYVFDPNKPSACCCIQ